VLHVGIAMAMTSDHRRLLDKLLRELLRAEARAIEHADREGRRNGRTAPVDALREVARHATDMRPRLVRALESHGVGGLASGHSPSWATVQWLAIDRMFGAERAFRAALIDLRHAIDVTRVLREAARLDEMFAVIRWCDDWLAVRRMLVAHVEAQQAWFARQARLS
jgi:hypothetical protein